MTTETVTIDDLTGQERALLEHVLSPGATDALKRHCKAFGRVPTEREAEQISRYLGAKMLEIVLGLRNRFEGDGAAAMHFVDRAAATAVELYMDGQPS